MKKVLCGISLCVAVLCTAGVENGKEYPVFRNAVSTFSVQDDAQSPAGKCYVIPRNDKVMEFGFYSNLAPKRVIFRRNIPSSEIVTDGKYHLYSLGAHILPEAGSVRFFVTDSWGLMLDNLLEKVIREEGAGVIREILVSLRADEKNLYLDRVIFSLPEKMKNSKGEIFQATDCIGHCAFTIAADPRFAWRKVVQIPLDEKNPMEFGFYDRQAKKVIFRQKIALTDLPDDGRYHLYSLGTHPLPGTENKPVFWCHDSWNLILTPALEKMQQKYAPASQWEIFAGVCRKGKILFVDQIIFASPAEGK